jgi:hypothetical protein
VLIGVILEDVQFVFQKSELFEGKKRFSSPVTMSTAKIAIQTEASGCCGDKKKKPAQGH